MLLTSKVVSMNLRYLNEEQRHQIEVHKYLTSELAGRDRGEEACLEWVQKYAAAFRAWAETLPEVCIGCGYCGTPNEKECPHPFNKNRLDKIEKDKSTPGQVLA